MQGERYKQVKEGNTSALTGTQHPALYENIRLHCKKRLADFPSPAGMSLTKLSLSVNILIIQDQGEFSYLHPGWGRKIANLFLQCSVTTVYNGEHKQYKYEKKGRQLDFSFHVY
jgi:hypothetical protein